MNISTTAATTTTSPPSHVSDDVTTTDDVTIVQMTSSETSASSMVEEASHPREGLYYFHLIYLSVAVIVGVPGNAVVVASYGYLKTKSSCDWYILYIGVLDLIVCLFRVPIHLAMETGHWQRHGNNALCKCVYWLSQSIISASVFLFGFIAIDRYIKVCRPAVLISASFSRNSIVLITLCSMVFALPTLWMFANGHQGKCVIVPSRLGFPLLRGYYTLLFATFVIMFVVVVVCYAYIIVKARRSQRAVKDHRKRSQRSRFMERTGGGAKMIWRRRRRNRVGVIPDSLEEGGVQGGCVERYPVRNNVERDEPSSQFSEHLSLSVFVRRLRNPMEKYVGDVCKCDTNAVSARVMSTESSSVPGTTPESQTLHEMKPDSVRTSPKLIPRAPTRGGSSDNILENLSIPGVFRVPADAAWTKTASISKEQKNNTDGSPGCMQTTEAQSVVTDRGLQRENSSNTKIVIEDVSEIKALNNDEIPGLCGNSENSDHVTKEVNGISSLAEQSVTVNNLKEGCSAKESITEENIHTSSIQAGTGPHLPQTVNSLLQLQCMESKHHTKPWTRNTLRDETPHSPSNSQLQNMNSHNSTVHLPEAFPSVFIIHSEEDDSSARTRTDLKATGSTSCTTTRRHGDKIGPRLSLRRRSPSTCFSRTFRLTLLLLLVTIVFVLSWIPPYAAMVWYFYVGYSPPLSPAQVALQRYGPSGYVLNHFANPLIYLTLSSSFRQTVRALWRRLVVTMRGVEEEVDDDVTASQAVKTAAAAASTAEASVQIVYRGKFC